MRPSTPPRASEAKKNQRNSGSLTRPIKEQADRMACVMAGTVTAKGNNFGGAQFFRVSRRLFVVLMANANCILHVSPHKLSSDISRFSQ